MDRQDVKLRPLLLDPRLSVIQGAHFTRRVGLWQRLIRCWRRLGATRGCEDRAFWYWFQACPERCWHCGNDGGEQDDAADCGVGFAAFEEGHGAIYGRGDEDAFELFR